MYPELLLPETPKIGNNHTLLPKINQNFIWKYTTQIYVKIYIYGYTDNSISYAREITLKEHWIFETDPKIYSVVNIYGTHVMSKEIWPKIKKNQNI